MKKIIQALASGIENVSWLSGVLTQVALLGLLLLVTHEVIVRYIFASPTIYSIEISEYLLVFVALMCAGWILREDRHIRMSAFLSLLSRKAQTYLNILTSILVLVFCTILVWKGGQNVYIAYTGNYHSSSLLNFPLWIPYSFVPVSALIVGAQFMVKIGGYLSALASSAAR